ncbi:MAG: DNA polymerase III subunit delta' [marine bacterium B5-7]|nr:MAG: DNA polymerase III subunit delta' [marine bacterium B5-7]
MTTYPWLDALEERFVQLHAQKKLPHAILLSGPEGLGKADLAKEMGQHVLGAELSTANPNVCLVQPEDGKIAIDTVRHLLQRLTKTASGYRVAIITSAHVMNTAAQNALLKTLEEPGENTLLILTSDRPAQLLPTIRSRCQCWQVPVASKAQALPWLEKQTAVVEWSLYLRLAQGAPLAAVSMAEAEQLNVFKAWRQHWVAMLNQQQTVTDVVQALGDVSVTAVMDWLLQVLHMAAIQPAHWLRKRFDEADLFSHYQWVLDKKRLYLENQYLNKTLLLSQCFLGAEHVS